MECKESCHTVVLSSEYVLIETLWNVKSIAKDRFSKVAMVLIETLWNVKLHMELQILEVISINRNIVECKESCNITLFIYPCIGINRNIVECKEASCSIRSFLLKSY